MGNMCQGLGSWGLIAAFAHHQAVSYVVNEAAHALTWPIALVICGTIMAAWCAMVSGGLCEASEFQGVCSGDGVVRQVRLTRPCLEASFLAARSCPVIDFLWPWYGQALRSHVPCLLSARRERKGRLGAAEPGAAYFRRRDRTFTAFGMETHARRWYRSGSSALASLSAGQLPRILRLEALSHIGWPLDCTGGGRASIVHVKQEISWPLPFSMARLWVSRGEVLVAHAR
jgi:hypothetical protein